MDDLFKCICELGDYHYWLRSFFKQVIFLLKRILANRVLYDVKHVNFGDDDIKTAIWKEIAYDYKGQFEQSDSSDDTCEDGCCLRLAQKLAQHRLSRIIKSLRPKSEQTTHDRLEMEKVGIIGSLEQAEVSESGLIDFLHVVAFILECIVANPVLYDRKNDRYRNEFFKLKVWNEICTMFHDKVQNNELELGDEDFNFEIKYMQKTIERHLHRLISPLNVTRKASKAMLSIEPDSESDAEYNGNESATESHRAYNKSQQPVTINIAPSKSGSQTVNIILNDGVVTKKTNETLVDSKVEPERSQVVDQLVAVNQTSTPLDHTESRSSQSDRAQKRNHGTDKDRSPETSKRKKSENENERDSKRNSEVEISPEADQHKKHKSSVSPSHERPARIKSVIQKKDATSDIHKPHNLRRK